MIIALPLDTMADRQTSWMGEYEERTSNERQSQQPNNQARSTQHDVNNSSSLGSLVNMNSPSISRYGPQGVLYHPHTRRTQYQALPEGAQSRTPAPSQEGFDPEHYWRMGGLHFPVFGENSSDQSTRPHPQTIWPGSSYDTNGTGNPAGFGEEPRPIPGDRYNRFTSPAATEGHPAYLQQQVADVDQNSGIASGTSVYTFNTSPFDINQIDPADPGCLASEVNTVGNKNSEPWSFFEPNNGCPIPWQCDDSESIIQQDMSDTTPSMGTHDNTASNHVPNQDLSTQMSTVDLGQPDMMTSMTFTEHPHQPSTSFQSVSNDTFRPFLWRIERSATPQTTPLDVDTREDNTYTL
ncbi:uncharacterized protein K460DRAFT_196148 [Cucurbitaria berberidis CBS 394.84]|uniref:Uncharacterized protein n=1 Tax=Cucurbitaria berberidis CBS 394.84 TaxID=1168544 RepID=A0A9P4G8F4_9PLEO|nr:uncharacterized protein K460DRAFT_196148 [Cucurbitaria berberidis CBS 394.84]KAF1840993.1 hypothetical protein K460DRAFT_196148 [Cucurbitaria berberidis CBS 394.84]